jgi:hypothetical protein
MEVAGLSFFIVVIVLQSSLTAPHCILVMNALFLIPVIWQIMKLRGRIGQHRISFTALLIAFVLEVVGIAFLTYQVNIYS